MIINGKISEINDIEKRNGEFLRNHFSGDFANISRILDGYLKDISDASIS